MTPQPLVRVTVSCERCGHRTVLAPAAYVEGDVVSLVCAGCETPLGVVIALPVDEINEPEWYGYLWQM
jgi:hypothetical protein